MQTPKNPTKDALLAARVERPAEGQLLLPLMLRGAYSKSPSLTLVDVNRLASSEAAALLSAHNSRSKTSTEVSVGLSSKLAAMACAVRNLSYKLIAASCSVCGALARRNTARRASNLSVPLDPAMSVLYGVGKAAHASAAVGRAV